MHYSPKHAAHKASPVRRRVAGVALVGGATLAGGLATAGTAHADGSVWDRVAACESGGNWSINTGNGFYGGLQFTYGTWQAYGGGAYASTANHASRSQQIAIAQRVLAGQGPGAWPVCSLHAGLTRSNGGASYSGTVSIPRSSRSHTRTAVAAPSSGELAVDGVMGPRTRAATERWVGGSVNGAWSRTDVQKLQRRVGAAADGIIGPQTTRALQRHVGAAADGVWGPQTTRALQVFLNRVL